MKIRVSFRSHFMAAAVGAVLWVLVGPRLSAQDAHFHNAPASSARQQNPYAKQDAAVASGTKLYQTYCMSCHGANGEGTGNVPPVSQGPTQTVPDGEVFWFITTGSVSNGMPDWGMLSEQQRWQIVSFVKSFKKAASTSKTVSRPTSFKPVMTNAPAPQPPFIDFRFEESAF